MLTWQLGLMLEHKCLLTEEAIRPKSETNFV